MNPVLSDEGLKRNRLVVLVLVVLGLHAGGLYALQTGLLRRAVEVVVPIALVTELVEPQARPVVSPPADPAPVRPRAHNETARPRAQPLPVLPRLVEPASPEPPAPVGGTSVEPVAAAAGPALPVQAATAAEVPAARPASVATPQVQLPVSAADYLNNRPPVYPPVSRRLGEQGQVVVRVFIDADGRARQAEIRTSSGYERLDQAALRTVQEWTYVPGKVNGEPKAMWFNVPIHFVLAS